MLAPSVPTTTLSLSATAEATPSTSDSIDVLLQHMTLEERVGQLFMIRLYGPELNEINQDFMRYMLPGSVSLFADNANGPETVTRFVNKLQTYVTMQGAHIPLIMAADQEGGTVLRFQAGFSAFPWGGALSAMPTQRAEQVGQLTAQELRAVGINMNLAPVADVRSDPEVHFMELRTFGFDPQRVGQAVAAYAKGMQANGVIAVLKHFPGHGAAKDSHIFLPQVDADKTHLQATELVPFEAGIAAGADAVMVGHLSVPALDPSGLPASLSPAIITDILRKELGFDGVIMPDALDMGAVLKYTAAETAVLTLLAGADMILTGPHMSPTEAMTMKDGVLQAIADGKLTEDRIDQSVRRVLRLKAKYGLLGWQPLSVEDAALRINMPEHATQLEQIFLDTIAITRDQYHVLPLNPTDNKRIVVMYPGAYPAIQRECAVFAPHSMYYAYSLSPNAIEIASAKTFARQSDLIVIFTYNIDQYAMQAELVNSVPPEKAIVVAMRNPYDLEKGIQPGAYIAAFNAVPPAFKATCKVLFGQHVALGQWPLKAQ